MKTSFKSMLKCFAHLLIDFSMSGCIEHSEAYGDSRDNTQYEQLYLQNKISLIS